MTTLSLGSLQDKIRDPEFALARINATYQPGGGPGSRVFPPTFPTSSSGESPYLMETRSRNGASCEAVVLDQVPSQANRCEDALKTARQAGEIRLPLLKLTHDGAAKAVITGLDAPHRA
ncbi:MAG: type I-U CRISPR-associated protein Cas7, partial [Arachnia propionica]